MTVYDAFKRQIEVTNICGIAFLDSKKIRPLQAADMFAWEFNRYGHKILDGGLESDVTEEMMHLRKNMKWLDGQVALRDKIIQIRDHTMARHSAQIIGEFAAYFRDFRPEGI